MRRPGPDTPGAGLSDPGGAAPSRTASREAVDAVRSVRRRRGRRRTTMMLVVAIAILAVMATTLMVGRTFYPPGEVLAVILGQDVQGATFTVGRLRLPRVVLALVAGLCFGLAGVTFQTMLRNPLASPDIIGISSGASAAAAFAIVILGLSGAQVSVFAIAVGLAVALAVYLLSFRHGVSGMRLILIGIGVAAMLDSLTSYVLERAAQWELEAAMRWLTGSLNGTSWSDVLPVLVVLLVAGPLLLSQSRHLSMLQLGDDAAAALGVRTEITRILLIVTAVGLIAFATAATGPIAFVAFLSGPIAARIIGPHGSPLLPAALIGALLVLAADLLGQFAFDTRFPVGVVTGALGAPYLVYLIIRTNRTGASL
ncbi:ABC-type Fe3+-siderophore transport system, permease 2 component [Gulosibacter sp. 10]|nr:ABC-type Fe3+-siderophore transport system, permease 2 component [Gulosibacter sp. 10]